MDQISGSTATTTTSPLDDNNYQVDVIDLTRLENLIVDQQQRDAEMAPDPTQQTQPMQEEKVVHVYRTEIKCLYNLRTHEKLERRSNVSSLR